MLLVLQPTMLFTGDGRRLSTYTSAFSFHTMQLTIANHLILDLSTKTFLPPNTVSSSEPFRSFNFLYVTYKIQFTADQTSFRRRLCEWQRLFTFGNRGTTTLLLLLGGVQREVSKMPDGISS